MAEGEERTEVEALLQFLKRQRGFDFTGYKRTSLQRRFRKRMDAVGVSNYAEYLEYLEVTRDEFTQLFDTLLINVTSFFRDPGAWEYIDEQVVPELVAIVRDHGELRVWSAGCASGEEAYSIAMLLVRALGEETARERVKIYATDIDDNALGEGRQATFTPKAVQEVPSDLLERCFERADSHYAFRRDLRRMLIFGRNDLVQDAPISRIDMLLCRNTLMYFTAETQSRILARFNFALRERGFLFLGKSEMLLTQGDLFTPINLKHRVFSKVARPTMRERLAFMADGESTMAEGTATRVRGDAFDLAPVAAVVVGADGTIAAINQSARILFNLGRADVGRPLQDLEISYRPTELRAAIDQALTDRRAVRVGEVAWRRAPDSELRIDVAVTPLFADYEASGAMVTFADVTAQAEMRETLERSQHELEAAYEELQSTVEELETTNEELQSTNEELETTNEELQSTNEELETMNEELQSTNEELETMNDELRERTAELNSVNASLETILGSLAVGVAVVDGQQVVRVWNSRADDLWGMRSDEAVGQHVLSLDIGLPLDKLGSAVREALSGDRPGPLVLDATNRRGRAIQCRVTAVPLVADGSAVRGAILLMEAER
jgi:two-component system, chemotaxis family, CheB/CheR fusion protein